MIDIFKIKSSLLPQPNYIYAISYTVYTTKVLLIPLLSVWILLRFLSTHRKTIPIPLHPTNLSRTTSQRLTGTVSSVSTPPQIRQIKKVRILLGYKNYVLVDCISGLPIYELTTTVEAADSAVALQVLAGTHKFLTLTDCTFLADKGYAVKNIYNQVKALYGG
jgi:hypothetical protein